MAKAPLGVLMSFSIPKRTSGLLRNIRGCLGDRSMSRAAVLAGRSGHPLPGQAGGQMDGCTKAVEGITSGPIARGGVLGEG